MLTDARLRGAGTSLPAVRASGWAPWAAVVAPTATAAARSAKDRQIVLKIGS